MKRLSFYLIAIFGPGVGSALIILLANVSTPETILISLLVLIVYTTCWGLLFACGLRNNWDRDKS